ncbi:hypothetical protein BC829DRAFT_248620 [Chytridium lagenaria]|nr:hypothetical protein BC829DRAFT_248620 [Chytridium lagenaria]
MLYLPSVPVPPNQILALVLSLPLQQALMISSHFRQPVRGLPDDLSFPLPQFPGGGGPSRTHREQQQQQSTAAIAARQRMQALQQQTQQAQVQAQLAAAQRQTKLQPRQSSPSAANLMRSTDLDIPVFDMDAFLQGSSPDDLDVFGDPINASNAASNAAAATSALLNAAAAAASSATSPSSFAGLSSPGMGFTALLQQQLTSPSNNPYNVYETAAASSATCSAPLADSARDAAVSQAASTAESLRTRLVNLRKVLKVSLLCAVRTKSLMLLMSSARFSRQKRSVARCRIYRTRFWRPVMRGPGEGY